MATTTCELPPMMRDVPPPDPCTTQTIAPPASQEALRLWLAVAQELLELRQVREHQAAWHRGHERAAMTLVLPLDSRTTATPNSTRSPALGSPSSLRPVLAHRLAISLLNAASWTLPLSSDMKIMATRHTIRHFGWVLLHPALPRQKAGRLMRCMGSGRALAQEAVPEPQRLDLGNMAVPHGSHTPPSIPIIPTDTHRGCRHMCKREASQVRNTSYADVMPISAI